MQITKHLPISHAEIHTGGQYRVTFPKINVFVEGGWMTQREPTQAIQKTGAMLSTMPIYPNLINSRLSSHSLLLLYSSQLLHFKVHLQFLLFLQD